MKKTQSGRRGPPDPVLQNPEKLGWIRKFCGRGLFRDIWKNRFLVLMGDRLFICDKEVKDPKGDGRFQEVLELSDYDRCEEIRKKKSRSKKNHSKFRLLCLPGNQVQNQNLVFLAVSPEEKESWILVLNQALTRAKNRVLDQVTVDEAQLSHPTRDRVKIPQNRRLPTRGHLLAVASSSSDGMLVLDLIQEEDPDPGPGPDWPRSRTDGCLSVPVRTAEASGKSRSLPREVVTPQPGQNQNRCSSMEAMLTRSETRTSGTRTGTPENPVHRIQELINQKLAETERLLMAAMGAEPEGPEGAGPEAREAGRLLAEATRVWNQALQVLEEVQELRNLYRDLDQDLDRDRDPSKIPGTPDCNSLM
ncbi:pleckstrin homology domain-containing family O member 1b [Cololabis saira]|uniref:pleckstrin homology domain-containing family O member 1b n=1 Tax=Cololabis saira TaxID=129043 RepID=UPI002AD4647E|nr:pleckstrin homology domain-containing family O member 1b [Cololabis saira]